MGTKLVILTVFLAAIFLSSCTVQPESSYPGPQVVIQTVEVRVVSTPMTAMLIATQMPYGNEPRPIELPMEERSNYSYPVPNLVYVSPGTLPGNEMVMNEAHIELLVDDIEQTIEKIKEEIKIRAGFITSLRVWNRADFNQAELRLNVPSGEYENTLKYLRSLGIKVLSETATGVDISAEYTDLEAQLGNLEATAARVRTFLEDARTVEDALRVNAELSNLEGQIEQIKGRMRYFEGRTDFSSISLLLMVDLPTPTPTTTPGWNPGSTVENASDAMVVFWQRVVDVLIWVVLLGWPFAILAVVIWAILRRKRRRLKPPAIE